MLPRPRPWDDVELHDWSDYSGEFGERVYRVRRVSTVLRMDGLWIAGMTRVEWYNPVESGTEYQWEKFDFLGRK